MAPPNAPTVPVGWRRWLAGARPRTLGAAFSPVIVGTAAAYASSDDVIWGRAALALVVAVGLQVGVNYANDYSDGVRGTDDVRSGPLRLTASGLASPAAVRRAAAIAIGFAALAGLALAIIVTPWLALVGVAAIGAAILYTGGPKPYGYHGLGELMVLVFFGFVATAGSAFVQVEDVPDAAWWGSCVIGLLACSLLLVNNVRDISTDSNSGKRTLAVRVGDRRARWMYVAAVLGAFAAVIPIGLELPSAFLTLVALPLAVPPVRTVLTGRTPSDFVAALVATGRLEVVVAVLLATGLAVS